MGWAWGVFRAPVFLQHSFGGEVIWPHSLHSAGFDYGQLDSYPWADAIYSKHSFLAMKGAEFPFHLFYIVWKSGSVLDGCWGNQVP